MQISTYIFFDGRCEEAFKFYAQLCGGSIEMMMSYEGSPAAAQAPQDWQKKIVHAQLKLGNAVIMGSDPAPGFYNKPQGFSISLDVDTVADAERVFRALSEGGTVRMPMETTFFAERFGMLTDRFGTPWMVICERPRA